MLDIFSGLRLVVKRRSISIDNAIFRCHWFLTSILLVSFSLIITARQYVGQPIECHSVNKIPDSLLNSYCWVQSTFTVPQACNQQVGMEVPYPCIDNTRGREIKMVAYYQWVGIVLFIQGLLFHLPYYLWKVWENGLIKAITGGLRVAVLSDQERARKRDIVVNYIHDHLGCHKRYAFKYFICEFICLLNLLAQLWATNKFFDGQFYRYGLDVMQYSSATLSSQFGHLLLRTQEQVGAVSNSTTMPNNSSSSSTLPIQSDNPAATFHHSPRMASSRSSRQQPAPYHPQTSIDPMTYVFPRITKCTYYDFGSSGDVQKHDALCLLPLNIINEKIYIALWFWFLVLAILTLLVLVYRLFAILSRSVRCKGLISRCKLSSENDIHIICKFCDVGDWFLFYMVAENLDPLVMREIVGSVADRIRQHFEEKKKLGLMDESYPAEKEEPAAVAAEGTELRVSQRWPVSLALISGRNGGNRNHNAQFAASDNWCHDTVSCDADSTTTSRRNSLATAFTDEIPLVKKIKKRLYSKRLWSTDLGSGEARQQLFGADHVRQPPANPDHYQARSGTHQALDEQTTGSMLLVSAPPASQMPLGSAPPAAYNSSRRASLSSTSSLSAASDSFVMEMSAIETNRLLASGLDLHPSTTTTNKRTLQRRLSAHGRHPVLRHRATHQHHAHHQSIASMQELRLGSTAADHQDLIAKWSLANA